jgi:glycosyltransferase involved in cell wall biosynthesis
MSEQGAQPLVTVLINNYNHGRFLERAIQSSLNQTYPNLEIILVDDGSTDNSQEVIAKYQEQLVAIFKPNGGQASAFNAGIRASHGNWICILDADDIWLPNKVELVVQAALQNPKAAIIYHRVQNVDIQEASFGAPWPFYRVIRGDISTKVVQAGGWWPYPPSTALSFSQDFLTQVMEIPEEDFRICADTYLADLAPFFGEVVGIESVLSLFRIHDANNWSAPDASRARSLQYYRVRAKSLNRSLQAKHIQYQVRLEDNLPYQLLRHQLEPTDANAFHLSYLEWSNPWEHRLASRLKAVLNHYIAQAKTYRSVLHNMKF